MYILPGEIIEQEDDDRLKGVLYIPSLQIQGQQSPHPQVGHPAVIKNFFPMKYPLARTRDIVRQAVIVI